MPRVRIKKKDYAINDFRKWLIGEMAVQNIRQKDLAEWLGMSQQAVSIKIQKSDFSLKELIILFDRLQTDKEQIGNLLKVV